MVHLDYNVRATSQQNSCMTMYDINTSQSDIEEGMDSEYRHISRVPCPLRVASYINVSPQKWSTATPICFKGACPHLLKLVFIL